LNKYLPALICGFSAGVLLVVPVLKNTACCLIVPGAVIIALALYKKANNINRKILYKEAMILGLVTGFFAAFFGSSFDLLITFITKSNSFVEAVPEMEKALSEFSTNPFFSEVTNMMNQMAQEIQETGFSLFYALSIILNNFIFQTILGFLASLAGVQIVNRNIKSGPNNIDDL
jgi:predicted PurR-regulated permease PerM